MLFGDTHLLFVLSFCVSEFYNKKYEKRAEKLEHWKTADLFIFIGKLYIIIYC